MNDVKYPELPKAEGAFETTDDGRWVEAPAGADSARLTPLYSDDQMRSYADATCALRGAQKESGWISVEERMPAHRQTVNFVAKASGTHAHLNGRVLGGTFLADHVAFTVPGLWLEASVWQPAPEPPTAAGGKRPTPELTTMNIYSRPGDKVVFTAVGGHDREKEYAVEAGFVIGREYTVSRCEVGFSKTSVLFEEMPGKWNSCLFSDAAPTPEGEAK